MHDNNGFADIAAIGTTEGVLDLARIGAAVKCESFLFNFLFLRLFEEVEEDGEGVVDVTIVEVVKAGSEGDDDGEVDGEVSIGVDELETAALQVLQQILFPEQS
nr:1599_t:CDS:2 [Entrophospora candida]CAG8554027.1 8740_t:CDS:2 [Entrophospora candida]